MPWVKLTRKAESGNPAQNVTVNMERVICIHSLTNGSIVRFQGLGNDTPTYSNPVAIHVEESADEILQAAGIFPVEA